MKTKENKVFIERAEKLTKEGISAMSLTDAEYKIFCEGKKQGRNEMKTKEERKKEAREEYEKIIASDWEEYYKSYNSAREEYNKTNDTAWKKFTEKKYSAYDEYLKKCAEIDAEDEQ